MKLFELLPCVDLPGQRSLTIAPPIDLLVKQALARLERRPSRQWLDATGDMETGHAVRLEVSLEELALLLERVDFSSSRLEDIEAMKFWSHLEASCELLEALGHEWNNHLGSTATSRSRSSGASPKAWSVTSHGWPDARGRCLRSLKNCVT